jgi:hypothetical protein
MASKTKTQFVTSVKPLPVQVGGAQVFALPKAFSTGSVGFNINGKVTIQMPDGTVQAFQFSGNLVAVGSKEWEV